MVDGLNGQGERPYVIARKGGQRGGGAEVTEAGLRMLAAYRKLSGKINTIVEKNVAILKLI
jgi:molybdate transport system regulatory protein